MKSMSWLLFEKEHGFLQECPACGFSACSPSVYRRHTRHCSASRSAQETAQNGARPATSVEDCRAKASTVDQDTTDEDSRPDASANLSSASSTLPAALSSSSPSADLPSIISKPMAGFSTVDFQRPANTSSSLSADFPSIVSGQTADFPDISCHTPIKSVEDIISKSHVCADDVSSAVQSPSGNSDTEMRPVVSTAMAAWWSLAAALDTVTSADAVLTTGLVSVSLFPLGRCTAELTSSAQT